MFRTTRRTPWSTNGMKQIETKMLLIASGKRWAAILQDTQDCWSAFHRRSRFPIHNVIQFVTHKVKQGIVYTVHSWSLEDHNKRGRPPDDPQISPNVTFIPQAAGLGTPLHEPERRILNPPILVGIYYYNIPACTPESG